MWILIIEIIIILLTIFIVYLKIRPKKHYCRICNKKTKQHENILEIKEGTIRYLNCLECKHGFILYKKIGKKEIEIQK